MNNISYDRHRFHPDIIRQAIWLYFRFTMSYRDVEDLLAERGIDVSYETVRCWVLKFGHVYAHRIRKRRSRPDSCWHLDEVFVKIGDQQLYLWRAVDSEGEVLDILVQKRRNKRAALKLMRKLLKNQGIRPTQIVTDRLGSYGAALRELGLEKHHKMGGRSNNRAENSHLPIRRRERKMQRFKSQKSAQIFLSTFGPIYNLFDSQRHLISRKPLRTFRNQAMKEWNVVTAAAWALSEQISWRQKHLKSTCPMPRVDATLPKQRIGTS